MNIRDMFRRYGRYIFIVSEIIAVILILAGLIALSSGMSNLVLPLVLGGLVAGLLLGFPADMLGSLFQERNEVFTPSYALHEAAKDNDVGATHALLGMAGVDINQPDKYGNTALHLAVENGKLHVVRTLLAKGVNIDYLNNKGENALFLAEQKGPRGQVMVAAIQEAAQLQSALEAIHLQEVEDQNPVPSAAMEVGPVPSAPMEEGAVDTSCPDEYCCPITLVCMEDPVLTCDGHSYERANIQQWLRNHDTSPLTNECLANTNLVEHTKLKQAIAAWRATPSRHALFSATVNQASGISSTSGHSHGHGL